MSNEQYTSDTERIPADLAFRIWLKESVSRGPDPGAEVKICNIDTGSGHE